MEAQLRSAEQRAAGRGDATQEELERLEAAHAAQVEAMATRLAEAESRLEEAGIIAQEHISAHDEELAGWHTRMQSYEVQLSQVNAQMAEQMGALVEVERSLSAAKAAQREAEAAASAAIEEAAVKSAMLAEAEQQRDTFSAQVDELIAARPTASRTDSRLLTALESERHELETRVVAMEEALKEASRVAAEAPVVVEKELADLRGQLGELARQLSAREEELAVALRERDEQRARAEALVNDAATAEQVTQAEPAAAGLDELVAGLREQLRAQEEELGSLREELQRANHRIRAVSLLSEQEFDPEAPDDLKVIAGIGPVLERRLREAGFNSYRDLAVLDDAGLDALSGPMASLRNRIRREHWVVQAKKLHLAKHGEQL
jgi:predicted flap endonuclease-1-like 5' DNA nuclease